ncbi:MAG: helix-turn-helix domain-containing protein, partial [Planctomycetota bacterium]
ELQNICERASVLCRGSVIKAELIRPWLIEPEESFAVAAAQGTAATQAAQAATSAPAGAVSLSPPSGAGVPVVRPLEVVEREQIVRTLNSFGGNRQKSAKALGIGVRTLGLKLKKWKEAELVPQTL